MERIMFCLPHQELTTGGVYVIHQLAWHLANSFKLKISLAIKRGIPKSLDNVPAFSIEKVFSNTLNIDALVVWADAPIEFLRALLNFAFLKHKIVLYLQGLLGEEPGNFFGFRKIFPFIVCSHWLLEETLKFTNRAIHVKHGLDRKIFFPSSKPREFAVGMMTHPLPLKGMNDGLVALRIVKECFPSLKLYFFGKSRPSLPSIFVSNPSRSKIAEIMRKISVFVCSSWEEGFGLPSFEAMACGAALATTDTKGSREFAIHNETALISPPKNPQALAGNIKRLLTDSHLRNRLTRKGITFIDSYYPSWRQAAFEFLGALKELTSERKTI